MLAVAVGEGHFFAAHDSGTVGKVGGNGPVKGYVRERSLSAPAGRGIYAVDKGLDALFDLLVAEVIGFYKGSKVGVKRRKCLSARPFVLHDAEEVDHLVAERCKVLCRSRGYLAGNAAETLFDKLAQRPAGAVAGEH